MAITEQQFIEKVNSLEDVRRIALAYVSDNAFNGSAWGILKRADLESDFATIKANPNHFKLFKLSNDKFMLVVSPNLFLSSLALVDKEICYTVTKEFDNAHRNAQETFLKKVRSALKKDKSKTVSIPIGLFCVNRTQYATKPDGNRVDAFQLDFSSARGCLFRVLNELKVTYSFTLSGKVPPLDEVKSGADLSGVSMCKDDNAMLVTLNLHRTS